MGTVFKLDRLGKETVLLGFSVSGVNGTSPEDGVIRDAAGNLYGTTGFGGDRTCASGTGFNLDADGEGTVPPRFTGWAAGETPSRGLARVARGECVTHTVPVWDAS